MGLGKLVYLSLLCTVDTSWRYPSWRTKLHNVKGDYRTELKQRTGVSVQVKDLIPSTKTQTVESTCDGNLSLAGNTIELS